MNTFPWASFDPLILQVELQSSSPGKNKQVAPVSGGEKEKAEEKQTFHSINFIYTNTISLYLPESILAISFTSFIPNTN